MGFGNSVARESCVRLGRNRDLHIMFHIFFPNFTMFVFMGKGKDTIWDQHSIPMAFALEV